MFTVSPVSTFLGCCRPLMMARGGLRPVKHFSLFICDGMYVSNLTFTTGRVAETTRSSYICPQDLALTGSSQERGSNRVWDSLLFCTSLLPKGPHAFSHAFRDVRSHHTQHF